MMARIEGSIGMLLLFAITFITMEMAFSFRQLLPSSSTSSLNHIPRQRMPHITRMSTPSSSSLSGPPSTSSSSSKTTIDWKAQWWPVAFSRNTDKANPVPFVLLEMPLVIWWDEAAKEWRSAADACPHRLAPLSEGRINEEGCIQCPYHGWSFRGTDGVCTKIPQLEIDDIAPSERKAAVLNAYPTCEEQGIIWIWPQPIQSLSTYPDKNLIPYCQPLFEPNVVCLDVSRDLPYSYEHLLENILDPSHVPYTHHNTISKRKNATPVPLMLTSELTVEGYNGTWERMLTTSVMTKDPSKIDRSTVFKGPSYMHHRIDTPQLSTWTVTYATPIAPGKSRILARFPFLFKEDVEQPQKTPAEYTQKDVNNKPRRSSLTSRLRRAIFTRVPDWLQHIQQNTVLDDDNIFLHEQERRLAGTKKAWNNAYYLPTKADLFIAQFRRWLDIYGQGGPFGPTRTQNLDPLSFKTREQLLDRYNQHVNHCHSCSTALKNIRRFRPMVLTAAILVATLGKTLLDALLPGKLLWTAGGSYGLALLLAWAWRTMGGLEQALIQGPYPPPRNDPKRP